MIFHFDQSITQWRISLALLGDLWILIIFILEIKEVNKAQWYRSEEELDDFQHNIAAANIDSSML